MDDPLSVLAVAEDIGVCAEPEVEVRQLTAENPFLVVASDGVFEFLTNQEVVNMVPHSRDIFSFPCLLCILSSGLQVDPGIYRVADSLTSNIGELNMVFHSMNAHLERSSKLLHACI